MQLGIIISAFVFGELFGVGHGANILGLLPYPGKSHFEFFHPLFLNLAKVGHDVTVLSYFPNKQKVANYTDLPFDGLPVIINAVDLDMIEQVHFWLRDIKIPNFIVLDKLGFASCKAAFESDSLKRVLNSKKKYDVVLTESFVYDCMHAVAHKLNAPVISLLSHAMLPWHHKYMGNPFATSFMPNHFLPHSFEMGFFQRINNHFHQHFMNLLHELFSNRATNELIKQYLGDSIPPIQALVQKTSVMLINQHFSLTGAMPYVPGIVEVGGLHIGPPMPLDSELQNLLDKAKSGVIYVSWGSLVRPETLSTTKRDSLVRALSRFKQVILLKWPKDSIKNPPANFILRDWLPQRSVLCHPNVKVFMNHGGMLGTTEGIHCGVSLVLTPFFGDQFLNAEAVKYRNAGVVLNFLNFNEENIVNALKTALSPSMQSQAKFVSAAFRNRPVPPLELATWWVEKVISSKGMTYGTNVSPQMNGITYYNLDIYLFICVCVYLWYRVLKWTLKKILCRRGSEKQKTQ